VLELIAGSREPMVKGSSTAFQELFHRGCVVVDEDVGSRDDRPRSDGRQTTLFAVEQMADDVPAAISQGDDAGGFLSLVGYDAFGGVGGGRRA
jgi:hypothetical protein